MARPTTEETAKNSCSTEKLTEIFFSNKKKPEIQKLVAANENASQETFLAAIKEPDFKQIVVRNEGFISKFQRNPDNPHFNDYTVINAICQFGSISFIYDALHVVKNFYWDFVISTLKNPRVQTTTWHTETIDLIKFDILKNVEAKLADDRHGYFFHDMARFVISEEALNLTQHRNLVPIIQKLTDLVAAKIIERQKLIEYR